MMTMMLTLNLFVYTPYLCLSLFAYSYLTREGATLLYLVTNG